MVQCSDIGCKLGCIVTQTLVYTTSGTSHIMPPNCHFSMSLHVAQTLPRIIGLDVADSHVVRPFPRV